LKCAIKVQGRNYCLVIVHIEPESKGIIVTSRTRCFSDCHNKVLPEHLSSPPVFSEVRITRFLVLCVCFVDRCLSFCPFSFGRCVVCPSSNYGFWLPVGIFKLFLYLDGILTSLSDLVNKSMLSWLYIFTTVFYITINLPVQILLVFVINVPCSVYICFRVQFLPYAISPSLNVRSLHMDPNVPDSAFSWFPLLVVPVTVLLYSRKALVTYLIVF
jgi:hypothetical protein